ncbi:MAG: cob(I)yrinic acid a,c-diamide adenosyltransferase [Acidobacteriota bacterium]|jgi:cob(I)alamin adenosyltransferase
MTRIYTKTGDDGTTGLIGGKRVFKDDLRIEAYGAIDELNAVLGVACAHPLPECVRGTIHRIQDDLFSVGANLALPAGTQHGSFNVPPIVENQITHLERDIDGCQETLEPLRRFILPGGNAPGALLHLARTVARRAERRCVALARTEEVDPSIIRYLNRLSDLCFVLARFVNQQESQPEDHPTFGKGDPGAPSPS